jgi:hypothetical protein
MKRQQLLVAELGKIAHFEPGEEVAHRDAIGVPRVRVANVRGEEFDETQCGAIAGEGSAMTGSIVSDVVLPEPASGSSV